MRILLATPPMIQLNTPYPATAYLTGSLRAKGYSVSQADPALELALKLFSKEGLRAIKCEIEKLHIKPLSKSTKHFLYHVNQYINTIDAVIRFLQGKDPTLAHRIANGDFLPQGPRFKVIDEYSSAGNENGLDFAFGSLGLQDRAQHLASLYIDDLADVIRDSIDPLYELSRYAERLAASAQCFAPLLTSLNGPTTLVSRYLDEITDRLLASHLPDVVGLTLPFPGNVFGGLRIAKRIKEQSPDIKVVVGGGYVNTELRELKDPAIFDYVDYITLDDGEVPFLSLLESLKTNAPGRLLRTMVRESGKVVYVNCPTIKDISFKDTATPTYDGLPLSSYLSICELLNPMHRLWSDGRWNKLILAHGCYWRKCSFCDISLDYISRYETQSAEQIADRMQALILETGQSGFHFVDEAAPPKILEALAKCIIERGLIVTWWGNIRFEKTFTPRLTDLLAQSGCIAVSGGLEAASDRLLSMVQKGVTVEQVARVTRAFTMSGVMVHAYLMYGFPSQTVQETIDALERVRQLFKEGCLQSAYWHRLSVTAHSPLGLDPKKYGVHLDEVPESSFAKNDLGFRDNLQVDHDGLGVGLKKALYNFMHGVGLDEDVRFWFDFKVPKAKVSKKLVSHALGSLQ